MRFLSKTKDGGQESTVDAYFLFEIKWLCSIAVLRFNKGSRANFHSHAFNALTWFIKGKMTEHFLEDKCVKYKRSLFPKLTKKEVMHKVVAEEVSWCLTFRGPWQKTWKEYDTVSGKYITLTHGRKIIPSGE